MIYAGAWDYWALQSKVTFDGVNKLIVVNPGETTLNIRADVYSAWVRWLPVRDNTKYLPAIRYSGYDPIGEGVYTGDIYFLTNGWKLVIDLRTVRITGVLYSDNYDTAYYNDSLIPQYPATVSALVNTVTIVQNVVTGDLAGVQATVDQVKAKTDLLPADPASNSGVWNEPIPENPPGDSWAFLMKGVLTISRYLGLK